MLMRRVCRVIETLGRMCERESWEGEREGVYKRVGRMCEIVARVSEKGLYERLRMVCERQRKRERRVGRM